MDGILQQVQKDRAPTQRMDMLDILQKDVEEQGLTDFIDSLTREQFLKIQEFFDTIPKLKKELDFKCTKCAYEEKVILEGIQSFFV